MFLVRHCPGCSSHSAHGGVGREPTMAGKGAEGGGIVGLGGLGLRVGVGLGLGLGAGAVGESLGEVKRQLRCLWGKEEGCLGCFGGLGCCEGL